MSGIPSRPGSRPTARLLSRFSWCAGLFCAFLLGLAASAPVADVLRPLGTPFQFLVDGPGPYNDGLDDPALMAGAMLTVLIAVSGAIAIWFLRRRYSRHVVERSIRTGMGVGSVWVTVMLTASLWVSTLVAQFAMASLADVNRDVNMTSLTADVSPPEVAGTFVVLWALSLVVGHWAHVRWCQVEPLDAIGFMRLTRTAVAGAPLSPIRRVLWIWLIGLRTTMIFAVGEWLFGEHDDSLSDFVAEFAQDNSLMPALLAVLCLGVLWLVPGWREAGRQVFAHPRTRLCLAAAGVGLALSFTWPPLGFPALWLASVVIAATSLQLMDLGPQPWLGALFLVMQWYLGFTADGATGPPGAFTLPTSFWLWVTAAAGTWSTLGAVRQHVLAHLGTRRSHGSVETTGS